MVPTKIPSQISESGSLMLSTSSLPCGDILELTVEKKAGYRNPFFDVTFSAGFTGPDGSHRHVQGFYAKDNLWMIRFRPDTPGSWQYSYHLGDVHGLNQQGSGTFSCTPSNAEGPIRQDTANPYRWVFMNGRPYFPIGLQDCVGSENGKLSDGLMDGEGRNDNSAKRVPFEEYLTIYGQAGFNLFRFSQNNCSDRLFDDLDHYLLPQILATDDLLSLIRKNGFRIMFGFFGFYDDFNTHNPDLVEKQKRFISYSIARWGVYVDFWELLNESNAPDDWTNLMANYIKNIDPDHKPVSTSWNRPDLLGIDINAPHWYESESELQSDLRVQQEAGSWKSSGKPVIVGEQGNKGMNWDPLSGLRMRIRSWTALFQEITLIFWNTSWSKAGMFEGKYNPDGSANIYLGPEERGYIRVLQDFSSRLGAGMKMAPIQVSEPNRVRAYGLFSKSVAAAYLHHYENHNIAIQDLKVTLDLSGLSTTGLSGEWIDPATGNIIEKVSLQPTLQTIDVPEFKIDLALLISGKL